MERNMYKGVEASEKIRNITSNFNENFCKGVPAARALLLEERVLRCSNFLLKGSLLPDEGNAQ